MNKENIKKSMFSHESVDWSTPQSLFDELNAIYNFKIDLAAQEYNSKCDQYLDDALKVDWHKLSKDWMWLNPPYSMSKQFIEKCDKEAQEGAKIVCLLPARTDTIAFHEYIYKKYKIEFLKGRLKFSNKENKQLNSAPFPSMLVFFKKEEKEKDVEIINPVKKSKPISKQEKESLPLIYRGSDENTFIINPVPFLKIIDKWKNIRNTLPILDCFCLRGGKLIISDLENTFITEVDTNISACFPISDFKILKSLKEPVAVSIGENFSYTISASSFSNKGIYQNEKDYPSFDDLKDNIIPKYPVPILSLQKALKFTDPKDTYYKGFKYVFVKTGYVFSSNSMLLYFNKIDSEINFGEGYFCKHSINIIKDNESVFVDTVTAAGEREYLKVKCNEGILYIRNEKYNLDFIRQIPTTFTDIINIHKKELITVINKAALIDPVINFCAQGDIVKISSKNIDTQSSFEEDIACEIQEGNDCLFSLNVHYLLTSLSIIDNEIIEIKIFRERVVLNNTVLLMLIE